ncbi:MAG: histidine kinase [Flavobacteriales bacterium]|nr:histidine kinase [Flavobacteriales bacterium]MCB9198337.1 histidine kinase [Flavobacteriales bacterium]
MKWWTVIFLISVWIQQSLGQRSQFQVFSVEEGLPQSQVYAMLMDKNHRIWLGTKGGGLTVFDGANFKSFSEKEGLQDDKVFALFQDKDNIIWIGTGRNVVSFNGLAFTYHEISGGNVVVSSILQDEFGLIWIATNKGIFYLTEKGWSSYSDEFDVLTTDVSCLYLDQTGQLWAGNDDGLFQLLQNGYQQFTTKNGLTSNKVRSINEINGKLLVGTYGGGLNVRIDEKWLVLGDAKEIINDVFVDQNSQHVWLATHNHGIVQIKPETNSTVYFNTDDGLSTNHTRIIRQDIWGNIWVGTSGGGLNKMFTPNFVHFNEDDGIAGKMFYAIEKSKTGGVWVSTGSNGFAKIIGDSVVVYNASTGFKNIKSKALLEDSDGNLWIGTEGSGVYYYDGEHFINLSGDDGLADNWIRSIEEDQNGVIWVATVSGISAIELDRSTPLFNYKITDYSQAKGLPDDRINSLVIDDDNRKWFGCQSGHIGFIIDNNIYFSEVDHKTIKSPVKSMDIDGENRLWIATEGNGLFWGDLDNQFISYNRISTSQGLNNNNVYLVKSDLNNRVWAGAGAGVDEISVSSAGELLYIKHYSKNEGFLGGETCSDAADVDNQGRVWIGTLDGLNCFSAKQGFVNDVAPEVFLDDITIFYESILNTESRDQISDWFTVKDKLLLHHTQNHLSFHFDAINLINPTKVFFQYQLEGFDLGWSPLSDRNDATYSNLPSGSYVFKVKAVNEDGIWSEELVVPIEVSIPYWKTNWFYALLVSGVLLFIGLIILLVFLRYRRRNKEEKEKLRIERNMLELEQKTLRLQMNPHFIFNAMNTVQALIAKNDTKEARYYLAKFSKLMRKILENSRHSFISIQDEIETLENYLNLEKLNTDFPFDFEIKVDEKIQPDAFGIPPLLLQPFVENAIVHGIKEIDYEGRIKVEFIMKENFIECVVEDNGRGRKAAQEVRHQKSSYHKSTALVLTQERLSALNKDNDYQSFEIRDLKEPSGTRVIVRIPIVEVY